MNDEKKLVIKIKRQSSNAFKVPATAYAPNLIHEWNVKRVVIAGLCLLSFIAVMFYGLFISENNDTPIKLNSAREVTISPNIASVVEQKQENKEVIKNTVIQETSKQPKSVVNVNAGNKTINTGIPAQPELKSQNKAGEIKEHKVFQALGKDAQKPLVEGLVRVQLAKYIDNKEPVGIITNPVIVDNEHAKAVFFFTELRGYKGKTVFHQWIHEGRTVYKRKINVLGNRWRASTRKMMNYKRTGSWVVRLLNADNQRLYEIAFNVKLAKQ